MQAYACSLNLSQLLTRSFLYLIYSVLIYELVLPFDFDCDAGFVACACVCPVSGRSRLPIVAVLPCCHSLEILAVASVLKYLL